VFTPGVSRVQNWLPIIGAVININTSSLYFQDHWVATPRLSLDLGTRFEAVRSNATGGIVTVDTTAIVPRLGATYDVQGNGQTVLQATYAHYAGKYTEAQFGSNTHRRQPEPRDVRLHGSGGPGPRLRARDEPGELHDDHQRLIPDGEHLRGAGAQVADRARVHGERGHTVRADGLREGDLSVPPLV
jgi:hypothetical protein